MSFKYIVWVLIALFAIFVYWLLFVAPLRSYGDMDTCVRWHDCPTPKITPTPTPTCTPSPTPTPSVTPTLTPTPTGMPSAGNSGNNGGQGVAPANPSTNTTSAPGSATCSISFSAPVLYGFDRVSPTAVRFVWGKSTDSVDNYALNYGPTANNLMYGVILPNTSDSYTVNDLPANQMVWGQVVAFKNGCGEYSQTIDP